MRLDFETFTTAGPTATDDSVACVDTFKATSVSILGYNTDPNSALLAVILIE